MNGPTPTTERAEEATLTIRHRGKMVAQVDSLDAALRWLHEHQPDSAKTAVTEGGYQVTDEQGRRWFGPRRRF